MSTSRSLAAAAAALSLAALTARSLSLSRAHLHPVYDEVAYLEQARDFGRRGPLGTIGCYLRRECLEDNRHPLYALGLGPLMGGEPGDFARAKLATLACAFLLIAAAAAEGAASSGLEAAAACAALLALGYELAWLSERVLADVLFAALYCASLSVLGRAGTDRRRWALFGALAGLAYLAKATAPVLLLAAAAVALRRWGRRAAAMPHFWLACAAFAAAAGFLLYRNAAVWGSPFHNAAARAVWLDDFSQFWPRENAGWAGSGAVAYWRSHSLRGIAWRAAIGAAAVVSQLVDTLGPGPARTRAWTGLAAAACVGLGLKAAWREAERDRVLAAVVPAAFLLTALSWSAMAGIAGTRFLLPIAASLAPFAARVLDGRRALIAAAALGAAQLLAASDGLAADPLEFWGLSPQAAEASRYLSDNVDERGFLIPYESDFSTWDSGPDLRRPYPFLSPDAELRSMLATRKIRHVLLDREAPSSLAISNRRGLADAFGPTSFLNWPRCFHDGSAPSRFLAFAPSCPGRPKPEGERPRRGKRKP